MHEAQSSIAESSESLSKAIRDLRGDERLEHWQQRTKNSENAFQKIQEELKKAGLSGPSKFEALIFERNRLGAEIRRLEKIQVDLHQLAIEIDSQLHCVEKARSAISEARADFIKEKLKGNHFIRMEVEKFGFDPNKIEDSLRSLLEVQDDRFSRDILRVESGHPHSGMALDLSNSPDRNAKLKKIKSQLVEQNSEFGG